MSHECQMCGYECDCDGEDHGQPQPMDCIHYADASACGDEYDFIDDDYTDLDEEMS